MENVAHHHTPNCPYCGKAALLVDGFSVYPKRLDLADLNFWVCEPCNARVGCHKQGDWMFANGDRIQSDGALPMGSLAHPVLRALRGEAHAAFDPLWKTGAMGRSEAYAWLKVTIGVEDCHIGGFDTEQCNLVIANCNRQRQILKNESAAKNEQKTKPFNGLDGLSNWKRQQHQTS